MFVFIMINLKFSTINTYTDLKKWKQFMGWIGVYAAPGQNKTLGLCTWGAPCSTRGATRAPGICFYAFKKVKLKICKNPKCVLCFVIIG